MIVESWGPGTLILYISIRFLIFGYRLKHRHISDGWRKTTEVHHRTEQSKFSGSIFNLAVRSEETISKDSFYNLVIELLSEVFYEVPDTHFSLTWKRYAVKRVACDFSDFTRVSFLENGIISNMVFYPYKQFPLSPSQESALTGLLIIVQDSYNLTKDLPDKRRPQALRKAISKKIARNTRYVKEAKIIDLALRILNSTWINFLDVGTDLESRNKPHWFYNQKNSGFGLINIHCRHSSEYSWADIWLQVSHTGMDGRAGAKLQSRIKKKMGIFNASLKFPQDFPIPGNFNFFQIPGQNVYNGCGFIDFTRFIKETDTLSSEYGKILPVAMLVWGLAKDSSFHGTKFNVPVDVPASNTHGRTVGFVFTKPQFFVDHFAVEEAFLKYLDDFNEQVKGVRNRSANNYYFLESSLMVPNWMLILMLKYMRTSLYSLSGSVCVTILGGIEYGIPSLSDNIDSVISITLPEGNNKLTGCVSVKSSSDNIELIFKAIRNMAEMPVSIH